METFSCASLLNQQAYITSPMRSPIFTMVSAPCNVFRIRSLSGKTLSGSRSSTTVEPPNSNLPFFFAAFLPGSVLFIISDLSDHQCTDFHHQDGAEFFIFYKYSILCCSFCRSGRYHLQSDLQCEKFPESFSDRSFLHPPRSSICGNRLL